MIEFDVLSRSSCDVQFTAKIDCDEDASRSIKLGLAVKWAVKNGVSLEGANLKEAYLYRTNLYTANLKGTYLYRANLEEAYLNWANLNGANLEGAYLNRASLDRTSLYGASLFRASLNGANGINDWVKCIQIDTYPIAYTDTVMQIGCQRHLISEWRDFDDNRIAYMDGKDALKFWRKYKEWIFQTIELCPAKPTGAEEGE